MVHQESLSSLPTTNAHALLPVEDACVLDPRPGSRRVLLAEWRPQGGGKAIHLEVATPKDLDIVGQAWTDQFASNNNLCLKLGMTYAELEPLQVAIAASILRDGVSVLAFEGRKLVGYFLGSLLRRAEFESTFTAGMFEEEPHFDLKPDYAKEIDAVSARSRSAARLSVMFTEMQEQVGKFLPHDTQLLGVMEGVGVTPVYYGSGLSNIVTQQLLSLLKEAGCDFAISNCVAVSSVKLLSRNGLQPLFEFPYDRFLDNGTAPFLNPPDGATGAKLMGARI